MAVVRAAFKPEFLNRLDEIVIFDAARRRGARRTSSTSRSRALRDAARRPPAHAGGHAGRAREWLALDAASTRPTAPGRCAGWSRRAIGDRLARALLAGEVRDGDTVHVDVDADRGALVLG